MADLRWGLLGASRIMRRAVLPAIQAAQGHAVVALAARDPTRAQVLAAELGIPAAADSYAALLTCDDVDAVYISLVNDLHLPWTLAALAAGKHVLCEKPLGLSAEEARAMADAARSAGRVLMEAFCYGFHPQIESVLDDVRAGRIGAVVSVEAQFAGPLRDPADYRWQAGHGGGALLDLGTYCVSLIRAATGREPVRVAGAQVTRGGVDASFSGLLDFGGCGAVFGCSFDGARAQSCRIIGTDRVIEIGMPFSSKGMPLSTSLSGRVSEWPPNDPYRGMIEHFGAAVDGSCPLRHGADDSVRQATVLDALVTSARTGEFAAIRG